LKTVYSFLSNQTFPSSHMRDWSIAAQQENTVQIRIAEVRILLIQRNPNRLKQISPGA